MEASDTALYGVYIALIGGAVTLLTVGLQIRERAQIRREQREGHHNRRLSDRYRDPEEDGRPPARVLKELEECHDRIESQQDRYERLQRRHTGALEQLDELTGVITRQRREIQRLQDIIDQGGAA